MKAVKQCIKASLEPDELDCGAVIPYHLIWFFLFSFPLRLFVCSHDFGCCLSSGGMYTCSSQTLVHLSALGCFWWSAMLLFSSSFFYTLTQGFLFLSVDFLFLSFVSPLTHLNFRCLSVWSLIELVVCPQSFISVGGCRAVAGFVCHPVGSTQGADALWPLYWAVWPFFLCMLWLVTLFDLCFLEAALYLISIQWAQQRTFAWLSKLVMNPCTHWFIVVCSLVAWKGHTAPFQQCGSALLILCCKWIWSVTVWLRPGVVLDRTGPNCGREAWAEECSDKDTGMVQMIHACLIYT